jgi:hypothetical protein
LLHHVTVDALREAFLALKRRAAPGVARAATVHSQAGWATAPAGQCRAFNAIYEEDFLGFSYGFRPGRGQHDALDALCVAIKGNSPVARRADGLQIPGVGAVCLNWARTDLCGGCRVTGIPTAIADRQKAVVALANKHARIVWAMLVKGLPGVNYPELRIDSSEMLLVLTCCLT